MLFLVEDEDEEEEELLAKLKAKAEERTKKYKKEKEEIPAEASRPEEKPSKVLVWVVCLSNNNLKIFERKN